MRIAIYGGSFNPMHIGHEKIVDYVLKNLDMDKIIIIPVGIPSHRENNLEQSNTRLKICREIFKNNKKVRILSVDNGYFMVYFEGKKIDEAGLLSELIRNNVLVSEFIREPGSLESYFIKVTNHSNESVIFSNEY